MFPEAYLFAGIFVLVGIGFGLVAYLLAHLLRPKRINSPEAVTAYECGIKPDGDADIKYNIRYLIFALIFVAFDVEAVFLYPWAVNAKLLGWYAAGEAILFVGILLVGYFYALGRRLLQWD
ncbi:MAG: NADH-quinone oxidoreductase subunit A [Caldisericia bacterium]|nr:NADH-quinone oxidoreductase subunit A [Caldisericia bacterium]